MPCDSVTTFTVNENTNWVVSRAERAAKAAGYHTRMSGSSLIITDNDGNSITIANGKLNGRGYYEDKLQAMKRNMTQHYSAEIVKEGAVKMGFRFKSPITKVGTVIRMNIGR